MAICEQCGKEHDGTFGSGRFCCRSCSNKWVALHQSEEAKARKVEKGKENLLLGTMKQKENPRKWSDEEKINHSMRMQSIMSDENIRKKISDTSRGRTLSEETRKKISDKVKASFEDGRNKGWVTRRNQESYAESFWRSVLERNGIPYKQEFSISKKSLGLESSGNYFLDFLLPNKIDLEIDGHQHYYEERKIHDSIRDKALKDAGYIVYRIKYVDPRKSLIVKEDIDRFLSWYKSLCMEFESHHLDQPSD